MLDSSSLLKYTQSKGGPLHTCLKHFGIASGLTLLLAVTASAREREGCNTSMLRGHYAHLIQGAYGPVGATPFTQTYGNSLPFQGIQMLDFDGKSTLKGSESLVASGAELTNNGGKHFVPVVGSFTINDDCTGFAYICSNHTTGTLSGGPNTCDANHTIDTPGFLWEDFVQVTLVLAEGGKKFHMLVVPPFDGNGIIRTISSVGTRLEDEPFR
jgi:hypothetical protein